MVRLDLDTCTEVSSDQSFALHVPLTTSTQYTRSIWHRTLPCLIVASLVSSTLPFVGSELARRSLLVTSSPSLARSHAHDFSHEQDECKSLVLLTSSSTELNNRRDRLALQRHLPSAFPAMTRMAELVPHHPVRADPALALGSRFPRLVTLNDLSPRVRSKPLRSCRGMRRKRGMRMEVDDRCH